MSVHRRLLETLMPSPDKRWFGPLSAAGPSHSLTIHISHEPPAEADTRAIGYLRRRNSLRLSCELVCRPSHCSTTAISYRTSSASRRSPSARSTVIPACGQRLPGAVPGQQEKFSGRAHRVRNTSSSCPSWPQADFRPTCARSCSATSGTSWRPRRRAPHPLRC